MPRKARDRQPPDEPIEQLPWWVQWWVPPSGRPTLANVVFVACLVLGWLPVVRGWRYFKDYNPWAGAVCGTLVAIWVLIAMVWMYRHRRWR